MTRGEHSTTGAVRTDVFICRQKKQQIALELISVNYWLQLQQLVARCSDAWSPVYVDVDTV